MRNQLPDLQKRQIEMDCLSRKWFKTAENRFTKTIFHPNVKLKID